MIDVVGIGPGDPLYQIGANDEIFKAADLIYGTRRQLESISDEYSGKKIAWQTGLEDLLEEMKSKIKSHRQVYLASGDPMLYGIGPYFIRKLGKENVRVWPGISSIQYLFSKIGLSMNDLYITSSHGRDPDFDLIKSFPKVAMVTDKEKNPYFIARELADRGRGESTLYIGEKLSYEDEKITEIKAKDTPDREYMMAVVVVINEG